jgi:hypothetical protein
MGDRLPMLSSSRPPLLFVRDDNNTILLFYECALDELMIFLRIDRRSGVGRGVRAPQEALRSFLGP